MDSLQNQVRHLATELENNLLNSSKAKSAVGIDAAAVFLFGIFYVETVL